MQMATARKGRGRETRDGWTADDLRAIPDDRNRYEIIDGELLVTPAPSWRHQRISARLYVALSAYLAQHAIGEVLYAPADICFSDSTVVEPDLFVVPLVDGRVARGWDEVRRLLLAVEILSPGTARADRTIKRRLYQRELVGEYWIIDGDAEVIERWRPEDDRPEVLVEVIEWKPVAQVPALVVELKAIFAAE